MAASSQLFYPGNMPSPATTQAPSTMGLRLASPLGTNAPSTVNPAAAAFAGAYAPGLSKSSGVTDPGNNLTNPGYGEQAFNITQNRLLEDPYGQTTQNLATQAMQPSQGENYLNQNLGTLNGPGAGEQYWNQQQGAFNSPFSGEQFARDATQAMSPTGPAGAFNTQAQGQYGDFANYQGGGNTSGQYGQSSGELAGGTYGENALNSIVGGYGSQGQYGGPNYSAGQYGATQQSFGDLPAPDSADPFYDRAIQLGTQSYNQGAAGRGVYGSSEALSGVGNVITDLNAKRAQTAFGNSMSIAQENRARQELLGNQARNADLSGLGAFTANTQATQTYGNLANDAGQLQLNRNELLGNLANAADTQQTSAQNARVSGLSALGNIASNADQAETNRYTATTNAMNNADRTALDRLQTGANIANQVDNTKLQNFQAGTTAATNAANIGMNRQQTAAGIAQQGSSNDLARLNSYNTAAQGAEGQRQARMMDKVNQMASMSQDVASALSQAQQAAFSGDQQAAEDAWNTKIAPALQAAGYSEKDIQDMNDAVMTAFKAAASKKG